MTPIIKIWIGLGIVSAIIEMILAKKRVSHVKGLILPFLFLLFGIYAWVDLSNIGIQTSILLAFQIPPIFLEALFELIYWKTAWEEVGQKKRKTWKGLLIPAVYWMYAIPCLCIKYLYTNQIRKIPDYYSAATYFFPGVWFIMVYFIFYYHREYKNYCKVREVGDETNPVTIE